MTAPAIAAVALIALFPVMYTFWESLHLHDLRMPWRGRPFIGAANYLELVGDRRFWSALGNTLFFTATTVTLELVIGLALALGMHRAVRGRGLIRTAALLPWAIPTVVAALLWRFIFDARAGIVNVVLIQARLLDEPVVWLIGSVTAWIPVILADVWKTTPFVALLLLAGLQGIDPALREAAAVDGASPLQRLRYVTLPLLKPAILVALLFRTLDAFRVFDLIYVLTGGGPGTATEPIALYTFSTLLQNLRFGYGSAMSVVIFLVTLGLAVLYIRLLGDDFRRERSG